MEEAGRPLARKDLCSGSTSQEHPASLYDSKAGSQCRTCWRCWALGTRAARQLTALGETPRAPGLGGHATECRGPGCQSEVAELGPDSPQHQALTHELFSLRPGASRAAASVSGQRL